MDLDAYGTFVSVDAHQPDAAFTVGLIANTQYADAVDQSEPTGTRRFRQGLEVVKRAVAFWQQHAPLTFVAHLGNVLAAENAAADAQWTALQRYQEETVRCDCKQWHLAAGDQDLRCFGAGQMSALAPSRPTDGASYYSFSPTEGWRVLVLDAFCDSLLAHAPGSAAHASALERLRGANPNGASVPFPLVGLVGAARRWHPGGGGLGAVQMSWLRAQVFCFSPTHPFLPHVAPPLFPDLTV